jgi:LysM repeat protein
LLLYFSRRFKIAHKAFICALYSSSLRGVLAVFVLGGVLIPVPLARDSHAHASLFTPSFAQTRSDNLLTMRLLEAISSPKQPQAQGGGDITVVDDTLVPDSGPLGTVADVVSQSSPDSISLYMVRPGDTISTIAELFGVRANTIRWANDLNSRDTIGIGQVLLILPIDGIAYEVQKGDTLASIAKKYSGDKEEIAQFNGLDIDDKLAIGTEIIIPGGEIAVSSPTSSSAVSSSSDTKRTTSKKSASPGFYIKPINGVKTQGFHGRYRAIDYGASRGTPVVASASGTVIAAKRGWNGGYGNIVALTHNNGTQTLYAHLKSVDVSVGQSVVQGQVIAHSGNSGKSTGPHLHFEIRGGIDIPSSIW